MKDLRSGTSPGQEKKKPPVAKKPATNTEKKTDQNEGQEGKKGRRRRAKSGNSDSSTTSSNPTDSASSSTTNTNPRGARGSQRGRGRGGGERGGDRGARGGGRGDKRPTVSATSGSFSRFEKEDEKHWKDLANNSLPSGVLTSDRCFGCLGKNHTWNSRFSKCPEGCPFCGVEWSAADGHFAFECEHRPGHKKKMLEALESVDADDEE